MNVITSASAMLPSGENTKEVISSVVDELAKMIIMVESGLRYFVNGTLVANPEPFFVKQLDYCTININVVSAELLILVPDEVDFSTCVALLIGRVNDRLHDLEAQISGRDMMLKDDNAFSCIREEYTRTVDSLIMPKGVRNQVMKRIFVCGNDIRERMPETAFRWDVRSSIKQFRAMRPESIWLADKADVYVNLSGAPLCLFTSHEQFSDIQRILDHLGVKKIIKYSRPQGGHFTLSGETKPPSKFYTVSYDSQETDAIKITKPVDIKSLGSGKFMHLRHDENGTPITPQVFFDSFMEHKHELGASWNKCQMCFKNYSDQMYALVKNTASLIAYRNDQEYAAICQDCMCSDQIFADMSRNTQIMPYTSCIPFSEVCESQGIPKKHALLAESKSFRVSGYVRDDASMAFGAVNVSLPLIIAIVKFRGGVDGGEFIMFG